MEVFWIVFVSLLIAASLAFFLSSGEQRKKGKLPPGPVALPFIGNIYWLTKSLSDLESILRGIKSRYGPIITLRIGSRNAVFISDRAVAHEALIGKGATFADRPSTEVGRVLGAEHQNINSAAYGPVWRLLRRNLMSEILHPSRIRTYGEARNWVLDLLIRKLASECQTAGGSVRVMEPFQFAMFCLLVFMCFGQRLDEKAVREIEKAERDMLLNLRRFNVLRYFPRIGKWVFRQRWNDLLELRKRKAEVLLPLIRARKEAQMKEGQKEEGGNSFKHSYVDSLFNLELPDDEGERKLTEEEMISLCSEILVAGTDTTSTAVQWIMANLVKYPQVQDKLVEEIQGIVKERKPQAPTDFITEEELQRMKYLKAVVLETLRRHPPAHFVLPHAVKEEAEINGYIIPKEATVNFLVAEMGMDEKVWKDPMEFKPERFLEEGEEVDITGTREIKMMPFGAGRRICPGLGLAMLHLEWFVANLVKEFEWKPKEGEEVDLTEKPEFTVVMKNPLNVVLRARNIAGTC